MTTPETHQAARPSLEPVATFDAAAASASLSDLLRSVQIDAERVMRQLVDGGDGKAAQARLRESLREAALRLQHVERYLEHTFVGAHLGTHDEATEVLWMDVRQCRRCGCTEADCSGCIERTGEACHWAEWDLCSACVEAET